MLHVFEAELSNLPRVAGTGVVSFLVRLRGGFQELVWSGAGEVPATAAALGDLARALVAVVERAGGVLLFPPLLVPGGVPAGLDAPALHGDGFVLRVRPLEGAGSGPAERARGEGGAARRLADAVDAVLTASRTHVNEVQQSLGQLEVAAGGSEGEALAAVEHQMKELAGGLVESLAAHRHDVQGASAWASDIIRLAHAVDEIAQSAHLLTFNARLESARLGEQGKGFVVIASAIRDLANNVRKSNEIVRRLATSLAGTMPKLEAATATISADTERQLDVLRQRLGTVREGVHGSQQATRESLRRAEVRARAVHDQSEALRGQLEAQLAEGRPATAQAAPRPTAPRPSAPRA